MRPLRIPALAAAVALVALTATTAARAADTTGFEIGARTGYAFSAGHLGAPPNGTDLNLGDYVGGQVPLWLDVGYRFAASLYLGAYFQYGFGIVNDDEQTLCRNANVDCSASDVRLGLMARYHFTPLGPVSPWVGFGLGYEWGSFSTHQSLIGNSNMDYGWSGFELANFQVGGDFHISSQFAVGPFVSLSLGQFQTTSTRTTIGNTTNTTDQDLAKTSLHEWILIGARFSFAP